MLLEEHNKWYKLTRTPDEGVYERCDNERSVREYTYDGDCSLCYLNISHCWKQHNDHILERRKQGYSEWTPTIISLTFNGTDATNALTRYLYVNPASKALTLVLYQEDATQFPGYGNCNEYFKLADSAFRPTSMLWYPYGRKGT